MYVRSTTVNDIVVVSVTCFSLAHIGETKRYSREMDTKKRVLDGTM